MQNAADRLVTHLLLVEHSNPTGSGLRLLANQGTLHCGNKQSAIIMLKILDQHVDYAVLHRIPSLR
jgi:hypothetical protein